MVNVRALHLWGEVRENLRTPVGAMLRLSGSSNKAMNSDSSVYNWEEESSFVPSKYRFVKISIWLDFYFLNMSVFLESILLNLIDFWLWVLSHMAAMNMNYTLLRGQKCQSFHIQKFLRYTKYETNKTRNTLLVAFQIHADQKQITIRCKCWCNDLQLNLFPNSCTISYIPSLVMYHPQSWLWIRVWHSWKFWYEWMSEYIPINKITRMNIRIHSYWFFWHERMSE